MQLCFLHYQTHAAHAEVSYEKRHTSVLSPQVKMVDALLSSKEPPMIIIQSDHGPDHSVEGSWFNINEHFIKERMGNLNVIYLPEEEYGLLYDTFSPVNTFRLFFKLYIDDTYTLLEDKSYFSDVKRYPYAFMEVKNKRSKEYFFNETLYNDLYLSS